MQKISHFLCPFTPLLPSKTPGEKIPMAGDGVIHTKVCLNEKSPSSWLLEKLKNVVKKVERVALFILNAAVSTMLYWVNPSLFAIGFIAGIILDDQVTHSIQKIEDVWKSQKLAGTLLGGFACALSLPVTLATASLLWSAHLGSLMSTEAQKILKKHPSLDEKTQKPPAALID